MLNSDLKCSGLDAPCPVGPDGLPLAGCGWRKNIKIDALPEVGTG